MSVTAAKGFVASGVAAAIRRDGKDLAIVRSLPRATGGAMFTRNKVQAACLEVDRKHLALAEPQAVVINSGVANAATGAGGLQDALATAAGAAQLLGLEPAEVLVLSTGVIGERLPMDRLLGGLPAAAQALSVEGGADAADAIMTTDTHPKTAVVSRGGFTVGGMAKGSGMIHPDLATMLAVVTTDYPLAPGEAVKFLQPAVDSSFNAISVDGEPSTNDAVILLANGASGCAFDDAAFATALAEVCADLARQVVADGEGITVLAEITVTGAVDDRQAKAIARRIATSPLVKTALFGHDANWGRVLAAAGSAPWNGGYADVDAGLVSLRYNGTLVLEHGSPLGAEPDVSGPSCTIELDLGLGPGRAGYLTSDLSYDYVRINADYRSCVIVVKVGGAVAGASAGTVLALATRDAVCVVHGAGPQISLEMERAGIPVEFVDGRRVTTAEGIEVVRASLAAVNAALCTAIGERAVPLFGDEIGLTATPVPALGLVGDAVPSRPAEVLAALDEGKIPVIAPIARGPLNVNADEAAAALAIGLGADRLLFLTDVDGLILDGAVVDEIDIAAATELLGGGTLEGGIIPKLTAAVTAARGGVPASIGRTAVPA